MRARYAPLLALALVFAPAALLAAPPDAPPEVTSAKGEVTEVVVKVPAGKVLCYRLVGGEAAFREMKGSGDTERVFWLISKKGERSDIVWWFKDDGDSSVTVVNKAAVPPPPDPKIDPKVDPKVDPPQPQADAPIPGDGLRVMLVFDRLKLGAMPEEQKAVVYGRDVRDYLRSKSPKGPDGVTPEARFWPTDTDAAGESRLWQDAFARAKSKAGTEPLWLIVSNGKTGFEGKPPATVAEMLALLKKYGG